VAKPSRVVLLDLALVDLVLVILAPGLSRTKLGVRIISQQELEKVILIINI